MSGTISSIQIQPSTFSPYTSGRRLAWEIRERNSPFTVLAGDIDTPEPGNLVYIGGTQWEDIAQAIITELQTIIGSPPQAWDGSFAAALSLTSWAASFTSPAEQAGALLDIFISADNPTFPGFAQQEGCVLYIQLFELSVIPLPFAEEIADFLGGNNDKFDVLTLGYKPIE